MASSMSYNPASGLSGMLKAGHEHYDNNDNDDAAVVVRSIAAATELAHMLHSSLGPHGRCKLVVNHLQKIIVTSDCASILQELEVEHPAAKLLALAVRQQEQSCGDATNLTLAFAGELLQNTLELIRTMGWKHATDIWEGYQRASQRLHTLLEERCCCITETVGHPTVDPDGLLHRVVRPVLQAKLPLRQDAETLSKLVVQACSIVLQQQQQQNQNQVLNVDAIRTVQVLGGNSGGGGLSQSVCLAGFVVPRGVETTHTTSRVTNAKIAVYASGMEASSTEAKGTVLMKNAHDLTTYNRTEEDKMEDIIASIAASGVNVVVSGGGNISDMALHFLNKYGLLAIKTGGSKWDLRRLCQACGATALVRLGAPTPDEIGHASLVEQRVLGGRTVTVFEETTSKIATIVLRASTHSVLNDLERAVDDGVHAVRMACKDGRLVYGGGAAEMDCAVQLDRWADEHAGLEQYAIRTFAKSLECVARTLADNAGWEALQVVADLRAAHAMNKHDMGVDIDHDDDDELGICSMKDKQVYDLLATKQSAFKLAVEAAMTVLKVDQIIMSKPSGGPKMPQM